MGDCVVSLMHDDFRDVYRITLNVHGSLAAGTNPAVSAVTGAITIFIEKLD